MPNALKVLLLSDTYSEHTEKWALGLASNGIEVGIFSFNRASYPWYKNNKNITVFYEPNVRLVAGSDSGKIMYLKYVRLVKQAILNFKPDILHAHYATSYGLIGALSRFHPFVVSAWGTDVMKFPQKNIINRFILKYNLKKADAICATSFTIQNYLKPVTSKQVHVIPFGVDTNIFKAKEVTGLFEIGTTVFGSVKPLEKIYNADVLINAFAALNTKFPDKAMGLMLIGEGSQISLLKDLVRKLKIDKKVIFTGRIPFSQIADYYNMLDVFVNISDYESFGVSVIEAMACEKPVIVTNTGGLKEIVENDTFGELVEVGNTEQTALAMEKYFLNNTLKKETGARGRQKVLQKYNWNNNIREMINVYKDLINKK